MQIGLHYSPYFFSQLCNRVLFFFMVKASQSTGLVITFFAHPQYALFVGIISSMVSSELFEESYDLRVKLNVLLNLI